MKKTSWKSFGISSRRNGMCNFCSEERSQTADCSVAKPLLSNGIFHFGVRLRLAFSFHLPAAKLCLDICLKRSYFQKAIFFRRIGYQNCRFSRQNHFQGRKLVSDGKLIMPTTCLKSPGLFSSFLFTPTWHKACLNSQAMPGFTVKSYKKKQSYDNMCLNLD